MSKENPGNGVNLLCEGTMIIGDIKTKNDIRIDGIIKGKIITSGRLVMFQILLDIYDTGRKGLCSITGC